MRKSYGIYLFFLSGTGQTAMTGPLSGHHQQAIRTKTSHSVLECFLSLTLRALGITHWSYFRFFEFHYSIISWRFGKKQHGHQQPRSICPSLRCNNGNRFPDETWTEHRPRVSRELVNNWGEINSAPIALHIHPKVTMNFLLNKYHTANHYWFVFLKIAKVYTIISRFVHFKGVTKKINIIQPSD